MTLLDDIEAIRSADPSNMYNAIFDFPEHIADGLKIGRGWTIDPELFEGLRNILLVGMGGSAIAGEIVRSILTSRLQVPFHIWRYYQLPEYVDDESLVITSSYSGNTEEILSAVEDALDRKTMIAAISTGGLLSDICNINDIPLAKLPTGLQPRAALGYSLVPLMMFLEKIDLIKNVERDMKAAIDGLLKYRDAYIEDNPTESNPAKNLAYRIHGKIPIIYSGPTITDAVAMRFKGQICENAKNLAYCNWFSEFNHNELVGWAKSVEKFKDHLVVIMIRDTQDHPQIRMRMNIVKEIIKQHDVEVIDLHSRGSSPLERSLSLIQHTDFTSYYLAILNEEDPTPVEAIEKLKTMLEEARASMA